MGGVSHKGMIRAPGTSYCVAAPGLGMGSSAAAAPSGYKPDCKEIIAFLQETGDALQLRGFRHPGCFDGDEGDRRRHGCISLDLALLFRCAVAGS